MSIDFLKCVDVEKTDAATVEVLKSMQQTVEESLKARLDDTIARKEFDERIDELVGRIDKSAELEAVRKDLAETRTAVVKLKGMAEGGAPVRRAAKSVEDQLREEFGPFIEKGRNGQETVDLRGACKAGVAFKRSFAVDAVKATPITSGSLEHLSNAVDPELSVDPQARTVIRDFANVAPAAARSLTYGELKLDDGADAEFVEEGGAKPIVGAELEEVTISARKVAIGFKVTEETMTDIPQMAAELQAEIISKIGIKEEAGILFGSGSDGEPVGVTGDLPAYSAVGLTVKSPTTFDAVIAAFAQIINQSGMNYQPNLVVMNPIDFFAMNLAKDDNDRYIYPTANAAGLLGGVRFVTSTTVPQGSLLVGDFTRLNIRDVAPLTITMGWENDDFTKNLVTILGEKRFIVYVKAQYKSAFVYDTIDNIKEAIAETETSGETA